METQVLTSNGTVQSGNVSAEYMATHDLSENKHSFVSYIKKDDKQAAARTRQRYAVLASR